MSWLQTLEPEGLRHWLRLTAIPMLASLPDGKILWANQAYERLTGYTWAELQNMTWMELTDDLEDRKADLEMSHEVVRGDRFQYQFRKRYRHKTSVGPPVLIDVLRYPMTGEFVCFFVSVLPLDAGYNQALAEVEKLHRIVFDFIDLQKKQHNVVEQYLGWLKESPTVAWPISIIVTVFLLGDRMLEIVKQVFALFHVGGGP